MSNDIILTPQAYIDCVLGNIEVEMYVDNTASEWVYVDNSTFTVRDVIRYIDSGWLRIKKLYEDPECTLYQYIRVTTSIELALTTPTTVWCSSRLPHVNIQGFSLGANKQYKGKIIHIDDEFDFEVVLPDPSHRHDGKLMTDGNRMV